MRKNDKNHDESTTQRRWYDLKPGDVIFFATGWYEVIDAYPVAASKVVGQAGHSPNPNRNPLHPRQRRKQGHLPYLNPKPPARETNHDRKQHANHTNRS